MKLYLEDLCCFNCIILSWSKTNSECPGKHHGSISRRATALSVSCCQGSSLTPFQKKLLLSFWAKWIHPKWTFWHWLFTLKVFKVSIVRHRDMLFRMCWVTKDAPYSRKIKGMRLLWWLRNPLESALSVGRMLTQLHRYMFAYEKKGLVCWGGANLMQLDQCLLIRKLPATEVLGLFVSL